MRPYQPRRRAQAVARGRLYLKNGLGWTAGFPINQRAGTVEWMCVPNPGKGALEQVTLRSDQLHQATYARNKLLYHYPNILPRLVDKPEQWSERLAQLLDWLKQTIHRGEALPPSLFAVAGAFTGRLTEQSSQLCRAEPHLEPVVAALSWVIYLTPQLAAEALLWLARQAPLVQTLLTARPGPAGIALILTLWKLTQADGERRLAPILSLLRDTRSFTLAMGVDLAPYLHSWVQILRQFANGDQQDASPTPPAPELGTSTLAFATWLAQQPLGPRRRAEELWALLAIRPPFAAWTAWWRKVERMLQPAAQQILAPNTQKSAKQARQLAALLEQYARKSPAPLSLHNLSSQIQQSVQPEQFLLYQQISATLALFPVARLPADLPANLFQYWLEYARENPSGTIAWLRELCVHLTQCAGDPHCLQPWVDEVCYWPRHRYEVSRPTETFLDDLTDRRLWPVLFRVLLRCSQVCQRPLTRADLILITTLLETIQDEASLVPTFLALHAAKLDNKEGDDYLPQPLLRCAYVLDRGRGRFVDLLRALQPLRADIYNLSEPLLEVVQTLEQAGWQGLATALVLDGEAKQLLTLHTLLQLAQQQPGKGLLPAPPVLGAAPVWSQPYPPEIVPSLTLLAAVTPQAERIAERILGQNFPNPQKVCNEMLAIQQRLALHGPQDHLQRRLDNLQARLITETAISPERLARLADKVEQAVRHAILQQWHEQAQQTARAWIVEQLNVAEPPDWLWAAAQQIVLAGLVKLPRPFRELGLRLIRRRCGPPPWDLAHEPANQTFLAHLRQQGINPDPWLQPAAPSVLTGDNGRQVSLALEPDPLEIFQMGARFETCLSPNDINFFSVFANAADSNKRVVYTRDQAGEVVGRCLLALTDEGGVLAFHPYCHDPALGFERLLTQFVADLARQMQSWPVAMGRVRALVAPKWYDDGARDLGQQFAFLQEGAPLRQALPTLALNQLLPTLESAVAPLTLNALLLPYLVALPEFEERPELLLPLLPAIKACRQLPSATWRQIAHLTYQANARHHSQQIIQRQIAPHLLKRYRFDSEDQQILRLLIDLNPSLALRILRRTRPDNVYHDEDERHDYRRALLADIHTVLGRTRLAQRLRTTAA